MESRKISSTFRFHFPIKTDKFRLFPFFPSHSNYRLRAIWTPNGEESPEIKFDWELLLHTSTTTFAEETVPGNCHINMRQKVPNEQETFLQVVSLKILLA
ncbi:hypothetical protein CDAR_192331 [Caerostris darwini]|uniref:Uncharacterized protein n=1 Tax=Caerostris darwini TaxID=1538125 RepID=A0AAV4X177_9ARAC|nr:hypothetical protein CDAR_192331 [Caerostris darwini]